MKVEKNFLKKNFTRFHSEGNLVRSQWNGNRKGELDHILLRILLKLCFHAIWCEDNPLSKKTKTKSYFFV